jgi:multisubunit Na+/H+ antiporter MnhB subunit
MADHLSIEIFGVLTGAADGAFAVGTLGMITLVVLALTVHSLADRCRKWHLRDRQE